MSIIFLSSLHRHIPAATYANKTIRGKVISFEESFPLKGVLISVKGGTVSTSTSADGSFQLTVAPDDKILVISHAEYEEKEVVINAQTVYEIVLKRAGQ